MASWMSRPASMAAARAARQTRAGPTPSPMPPTPDRCPSATSTHALRVRRTRAAASSAARSARPRRAAARTRCRTRPPRVAPSRHQCSAQGVPAHGDSGLCQSGHARRGPRRAAPCAPTPPPCRRNRARRPGRRVGADGGGLVVVTGDGERGAAEPGDARGLRRSRPVRCRRSPVGQQARRAPPPRPAPRRHQSRRRGRASRCGRPATARSPARRRARARSIRRC